MRKRSLKSEAKRRIKKRFRDFIRNKSIRKTRSGVIPSRAFKNKKKYNRTVKHAKRH